MQNPFHNYPVLLMIAHKFYWVEDQAILADAKQISDFLSSGKTPLLCHRSALYGKLNIDEAFGLPCLDILESISFLYPTFTAPPNLLGIAKKFNLAFDKAPEKQALLLRDLAESLLNNFQTHADYNQLVAMSYHLKKANWEWSKYFHGEMAVNENAPPFEVWKDRAEWQHHPILPPSGQKELTEGEIDEMLLATIQSRQGTVRETQNHYSHAVNHIFQPVFDDAPPHASLLQAHTGTGKTLGYLIPAFLYSQKNKNTIWISTYTRNLQHQIYHEALQVNQQQKSKITIRKGRENYLCLLNYQQAIERALLNPNRFLIGLALTARWISKTKFGDMNGDDFSPWLEDLFQNRLAKNLADRHNHCIHHLCPHFKNCFVENSKIMAKQADIVITNHALSLNETESGNLHNNPRITHFIFDEAHHLFQAADNFYAKILRANEAAQLFLWLNDGNPKQALTKPKQHSFYRGLRMRLGKIAEQNEIAPLLEEIAKNIDFLPKENWCDRILKQRTHNISEIFFIQLNYYTINYNKKADPYYNLEAPTIPIPDGLKQAASDFSHHIYKLISPLDLLCQKLKKLIEEKHENSLPLERIAKRLEATNDMLNHWKIMLDDLAGEKSHDNIVDWLCVKRKKGVSYDFEFSRHYINPMQILSDKLLKSLSGFAMTSASLFPYHDIKDDTLTLQIQAIDDFPSPLIKSFGNNFDYQNQAKIFIASDVKIFNRKALSHAYYELLLASGGGGLGLFTAVKRMQETYADIVKSLAAQNINLYAQHIDKYSVANLVEIFKNEEDACLFGTDSLRDGIDVPGNGLRLVILEKMPWSRPDILTRARQSYFGSNYTERMIRFRLKQAFGRLIRHKDDKGAFILLDSQFPSRMRDIFPEEIEINRMPFAQIKSEIKEFLP